MKILDTDWCFKLVNKTNKKLKLNNHFLPATCVYREKTIYVSNQINITDFNHIILHELVHAIIYTTQISIDKQYTEEDVCEFVGKYYMVLKSILESPEIISLAENIKSK